MSAGRPLIAEGLDVCRAQIEDTLFAWPVLESLVARREAGVTEPEDARRATELAATLCRLAEPDGSWGGDLFRTAGNLLLLREIEPEPDTPTREAAAAACAWLMQRKDQVGRFGAGCEPEAHAAELCSHFVSGFFAPADPGTDLAGTTLVSGGKFHTDEAARFAGTCLALRALVTWDARRADVADGLASLSAIVRRHAPGDEPLGCAGYALAVGAVGAIREPEPERVATLAGLTRLAAAQRADGSWPGVDLFHVLGVLTDPVLAVHRLEAAEVAIQRAAGMLSLMVGSDGSWTREPGPVRTLVAWRALRRAVAHASD